MILGSWLGCGPGSAPSAAQIPAGNDAAPGQAPGLEPPHPHIPAADDQQELPANADQRPTTPAPRPPPAYALDPVSRKIPLSGKAFCPAIDLMDYRGSVIPFHKPLRIVEPFRAHVEILEEIARDTAIEVYGRPPTRIRHFGSYYCRRISTWPYLVSEHGMGNALDIGGFDFARLKKSDYPDAPRRWRKSFSVRMSRHWRATGKNAEHSRFLRLFARRVIDRPGLFRVVLGPAHPGHNDHLHLDMARHRVINVF